MSVASSSRTSLITGLVAAILVVSATGLAYGITSSITLQNLTDDNNNLRTQVSQLQQNVTSLSNNVNQLKNSVPVTEVDGTATSCPGTPYEIRFDNSTTGTLSSVVFSANNYRVYLPSKIVYNVYIVYGSNVFVPAKPATFTPVGPSMTGIGFTC